MLGYKHIVFDIDGTLADSYEASVSSLRQVVYERTGKSLDDEELAFSFGIPGADTLKRLGMEADALQRWAELENAHASSVAVFDGVWLMLAELSEEGFELGIVSSRAHREYEAAIEPLGFCDYFKTVVLAEDTEQHKPSAAPMLAYIAKAGAAPEEVLYVGDTAHDSACARAAGVDFAFAQWGARQVVDGYDFLCTAPGSVVDVARFGEH